MSAVDVQGNNTFLTKENGKVYKVTKGNVLCFVVPSLEGYLKRRIFLCEVKEGEYIPSLNTKAPLGYSDTLYDWNFLISSTDSAVIEESTDTDCDSVRDEFFSLHNVKTFNYASFDEACVEYYQFELVRESRNVYASDHDLKRQNLQHAKKIIGVLSNSKYLEKLTGNTLYDSIAKICDYSSISLCDYDIISKSQGGKATPFDIARISGFSIRKIILDFDLHRCETGPLLCFDENENKYVALIPKGKHYAYFDSKAGVEVPLEDKYIESLSTDAYVLYRPFPRKKLTFKDVFRFALKDICLRDIVTMLVLMLLGTLIGLLLPKVTQVIYDIFIPLGDKKGIVGLCVIVAVCYLANIAFEAVGYFSKFRLFERVKYSIEAAVYDRLFSFSNSFYRHYDSAELGNMARGVSAAVQSIRDVLASSVVTALFSVFYLYRMFGLSGLLSSYAMLLLFVTVAIVVVLAVLQARWSKKSIKSNNRSVSMLNQYISGIEKLRISGSEKRALYKFMDTYTDTVEYSTKAIEYFSAGDIILSIVPSISLALFYFLIVNSNLSISIGVFLAFISAFTLFSNAIVNLVISLIQYIDSYNLIKNSKPIFENVPEKSSEVVVPEELSGSVHVDNLVFGYDDDNQVIKGISFNVKPGEYVGIVGSSGCGKSTLLKLLLGFEKPNSGKIYYDDYDIETLDKRELRKKFGVVLQDGDTFNGSIYENIVITNPSVSVADVMDAVEACGLKEDIDNMPMGLNTILSGGAGGVSGGQKQRILIARSIVTKPKILFFDEATSALDNKTQEIVCNSVAKLGCTRLVIAHRLSTIKECDRIIVLDKGKIIEEGTFDSLMEQKGFFYELASRQI